MAITLSSLTSQVRHALGGSPSSLISEAQIINEAGRYLFCTPWNFREKQFTTVVVGADQSSVPLPASFGEMVAISMPDGQNKGVQFTTPDDLLARQSSSIQTAGYYWATIVYPYTQVDAVPNMQPVLEIWPTPSASETFRIQFRSEWVELADDDDIAAVPIFAESALISLVRAFALGYEEDGLQQRLAEVERGPIFDRAKAKDGLIQNEWGPIRNGAVQMTHSPGHLPWDTIPGPS